MTPPLPFADGSLAEIGSEKPRRRTPAEGLAPLRHGWCALCGKRFETRRPNQVTCTSNHSFDYGRTRMTERLRADKGHYGDLDLLWEDVARAAQEVFGAAGHPMDHAAARTYARAMLLQQGEK